jgi:hypothetical protein
MLRCQRRHTGWKSQCTAASMPADDAMPLAWAADPRRTGHAAPVPPGTSAARAVIYGVSKPKLLDLAWPGAYYQVRDLRTQDLPGYTHKNHPSGKSFPRPEAWLRRVTVTPV